VWSDTRTNIGVNLIKTLNLAIRSFMSADIQAAACALTYRTLLAIVPALALLFAIGRGFGFQNLLASQLFNYFPSQQQALETAFTFVDSYLAQASEGIFVGIGILFLLWTLISLVGSVENAFNQIWGIRKGRPIWRKITDYTAIFLILPVLMICSSGLTIFMSSTLQNALPDNILSPAISVILDFTSAALIWMFFICAYVLIPNTKVKFKHAIVAGVLAGIAFQLLQGLFVNGQIYVSKYNAIYGGFAFLPLLLIWLQLVWVITLAGAVLCYSSQNIFQFSFTSEVTYISLSYRRKVSLAIMGVIVKRFRNNEPPLYPGDFVIKYNIPPRLVESVVDNLADAGLVSRVLTGEHNEVSALQPAVDISTLTVGEVIKRLDEFGTSDFIPSFDTRFASINNLSTSITDSIIQKGSNTLMQDLDIPAVNSLNDTYQPKY
jgi:membrane protein